MYSIGKGNDCQSFSVVTAAAGTQRDSLVFGIDIRVGAHRAEPDEARVQEHLLLLLLPGQAPEPKQARESAGDKSRKSISEIDSDHLIARWKGRPLPDAIGPSENLPAG